MKLVFKVLDKPTCYECDQILKMARKAFGVRAESIYFLRVIADYGKIFATYDNDKPICAIQTIKRWDRADGVQMISTAVHPDYQGKSIATYTATHMLDYLRLEGIKLISIFIPPKHTAMFSIFQEKLGFKICKECIEYFGIGEDRLYLEKEL